MALEAAAVSGSAALGCSTIGIALYANAVAWRNAANEETEESPGYVSRAIAATCRQVMKAVEAPALVSAAMSDPMEELRLAVLQGEVLASAAECSVNGKTPASSFVTFNGEVLKVGGNLASVIPTLALGGAEVSLEGKDITIVPKQSPPVIIQLGSVAQANEWEAVLKRRAREISDPATQLEKLLHQASDLQKALADLQVHVHRHSTKHHDHNKAAGHGKGHGHDAKHSECDGHGHADHGHAGHENACAGHADGHDGHNNARSGHAEHAQDERGNGSGFSVQALTEALQKAQFQLIMKDGELQALTQDLHDAHVEAQAKELERLEDEAKTEFLVHHAKHLEAELQEPLQKLQRGIEPDVEGLQASLAAKDDVLDDKEKIIASKEYRLTALENRLEEQQSLHERHTEELLASNLALQKEANELCIQLEKERGGVHTEDWPRLQQAQQEIGNLSRLLSTANQDVQQIAGRLQSTEQELEQMREIVNAADKELAVHYENQALASSSATEKHQEELEILREELGKTKVQAESYKEQAEQANQANKDLAVRLHEEKFALLKDADPQLLDEDSFRPEDLSFRADKHSASPYWKLTARELQAIQAHLQSVHKRAGAAEARSRTLEKDKASIDTLKQMLSEQREHYERQLQALSMKLEEQSMGSAKRKQTDELSPSVAVTERTKQMEHERFAFGQELELVRGQQVMPIGTASSSGASPRRGLQVRSEPGVPINVPVVPARQVKSVVSSAVSPYRTRRSLDATPIGVQVLTSPVANVSHLPFMHASSPGVSNVIGSTVLSASTTLPMSITRPARPPPTLFSSDGGVSRRSFGTPPTSLGMASLGAPMPSLWTT